MDHTNKALNDFGIDLFASMPVKDFGTSLAWYERLFGCPPSFFPNETEAVWQIAEHRWIYVIVAPDRAGGAITTILGDNLDKLIDEIAERGINFEKEENPAQNVRKVMYYDPDGNEIGLGSASSE